MVVRKILSTSPVIFRITSPAFTQDVVHIFTRYGMCDAERGVIGWLDILGHRLSHLLDLGQRRDGLAFARYEHD
jgi:hypothetical protein